MRILVFEHDSDAPAALLVAWADSRDHELEVVAGRRPESWPTVDDFDAIVSLGSEQSATQSDVPLGRARTRVPGAGTRPPSPDLGDLLRRPGAGQGTRGNCLARTESRDDLAPSAERGARADHRGSLGVMARRPVHAAAGRAGCSPAPRMRRSRSPAGRVSGSSSIRRPTRGAPRSGWMRPGRSGRPTGSTRVGFSTRSSATGLAPGSARWICSIGSFDGGRLRRPGIRR